MRLNFAVLGDWDSRCTYICLYNTLWLPSIYRLQTIALDISCLPLRPIYTLGTFSTQFSPLRSQVRGERHRSGLAS